MTLTQPTQQVDKNKIWKVGLLAVVAATAANLVAFFILNALLDLPSSADFPPLSAGTVGLFTAVFTFMGVVVFALIVRFTHKPVRNFWIIATIVFVLSIIPNIISAMNPAAAPFPFPVSSSLAFWVLIIFHIIAYLVLTLILTSKTKTN